MTRRHALTIGAGAAVLCGYLCWHVLVPTAPAAAKPRVTKKKGIRIYADNDNFLCFVCHIDFDGEELTAQHARHGVTCASCHGECAAHMADEMSATKPDLLYGRTEVEPLCRKCHGKHNSPDAVEEFRTQWEGKHRPNGRSVTDDSPCTDCHGKHVILKPSMTG
ncbi:MAG: cytochrome c3 family protein [Armatimonadota bacterium]|jgi:hypothetical protein